MLWQTILLARKPPGIPMRKITPVIFAICSLVPFLSYSQTTRESPFSFSCDLLNRYVWRGLNLGGNTPSAQPTIGFGLKKGNHAFGVNAFGAYSFGGQQLQESDLFLSYTWNKLFGITVTDYFFPVDDGTGAGYFHYKQKETGHLMEGMVQFLGNDKIPFYALFAINFFGADALINPEDTTLFEIAKSKYLEVGYTRKYSNMEWKIFAGAALDNPDEAKGETGFYGNTKPAIVNLGCKLTREVQISDHYSLPLQAQLIFNPSANRIFMVFGLTL
jgi:hypothetical protein